MIQGSNKPDRLPISFEAVIKLLIEIKNLEENRMAIVIDRNNNNEKIMI